MSAPYRIGADAALGQTDVLGQEQPKVAEFACGAFEQSSSSLALNASSQPQRDFE